MTHCSAEGLSTPHPHQTYTHAGCRHDAWTCQQTQTSGRVLTQKHTYAASSLHTQTHIWGHFSLWHYSTRSDTHTHTRRARRPDGITAWAVGLSHSGGLDFSPFLLLFRALFLPLPHPTYPLLCCSLSSLSARPRLGLTFSALFI